MNNLKSEHAIGIFDSGIGGLTVLRAIKRLLPQEHIMYLGDTARVPYGTRSAQTVLKYSIANTDFLLRQNIKLLVIACNTASAVATDALRERYAIPIIEVITPGARGSGQVIPFPEGWYHRHGNNNKKRCLSESHTSLKPAD